MAMLPSLLFSPFLFLYESTQLQEQLPFIEECRLSQENNQS